MAERKKLGDLLLEAKVISPVQLTSALAHQKQWGGRLGSAMIEKGFLTEDVLAKFLSMQLNVPSVALSKLKITMDVLQRVPRDLQEKHFAIPIAVLKEGKRESLVLAMCDPTDMGALDEIGFATGLKVKPVVATETSIKKFLQGGTHGSSYRERSVEREIQLPDPSNPGMSSAPVGEQELVLEMEPTSSGVIMGTVDEPPIARGVIEVSPVAPPPAAIPRAADPFAAAVLARSGPAAAGAPQPAPFLGAPMPPAPPVPEIVRVAPRPPVAAPLPELSVDPFGVLPDGDFDSEDRTEVDIPAASSPAPAAAAAPVVSVEPEPEPPTATRPSFQPPIETAWDTQPGSPDAAPIGGPAPLAAAPAIVARGALVTDEPIDEISLPGPEPLVPPAELLQESPSKSFAIPTDLEIAEPTVLDAEPPAMAVGQVLPAAEAPPENALAEAEATAFGEPASANDAPAAETFSPAPESFAPDAAPESFAPGAETWSPAPETFVPAPESLEPPPESFEPPAETMAADTRASQPEEFAPAPEGFEAAPDMPADTLPGDAPFSVENPADTWSEPAPAESLAAPDWGAVPADAAPEAEPPPSPPPPSSTEMGAVPVMTSMSDHADEGTVLNAGAFEPTWSGDASQIGGDLAYSPSVDAEPPTKTREAVLPPVAEDRRPPIPPRAPSGTVVNAPAPEPERTGSTELRRPELTPEPSREPTPAPRTGISDEQAALNATITKKLKLLNAIAELLLEKGLITEDEIKEKISKKRG